MSFAHWFRRKLRNACGAQAVIDTLARYLDEQLARTARELAERSGAHLDETLRQNSAHLAELIAAQAARQEALAAAQAAIRDDLHELTHARLPALQTALDDVAARASAAGDALQALAAQIAAVQSDLDRRMQPTELGLTTTARELSRLQDRVSRWAAEVLPAARHAQNGHGSSGLALGAPASTRTGSGGTSPPSELARFIPNAIPKSGTNLLQKVLEAVPALHQREEYFPTWAWHANRSYRALAEEQQTGWVPVDIDLPHMVRASDLEALFTAMRPGEYIKASHLLYSEPLCRLMQRHEIRMLLNVRDPRDVVVSQVHYTLATPTNPLHEYYKRLGSFEACLLASITGSAHVHIGQDIQHVSIAQRFANIQGWLHQPFVLLLRFEDLIGERGGGSAQRQRETIERALRHIGVQPTEDVVAVAADKGYSRQSPTFRRGMIGEWRDVFTPEIKLIFKERAGQTLIDFGYEPDFDW